MRKVLILALMSMFFAAMACNKQEGASSPETSPSEAASPAGGEASPAGGGMASPAGGGGMASPAGGEASPAAAPS